MAGLRSSFWKTVSRFGIYALRRTLGEVCVENGYRKKFAGKWRSSAGFGLNGRPPVIFLGNRLRIWNLRGERMFEWKFGRNRLQENISGGSRRRRLSRVQLLLLSLPYSFSLYYFFESRRKITKYGMCVYIYMKLLEFFILTSKIRRDFIRRPI